MRIPRALAAGMAMAALLVAPGCRRQPAPGAGPGPGPTVEPTPVPARVVLFFPGDDTFLHREVREVPELPVPLAARARVVIEELLAGSREGWAGAFPWAATLDTVFADSAGNVYLDFSAPPPGAIAGTTSEMALAYATVDSIVANCPGTARVQLLFGGREVESFGHVDLSRPLAPRPDLVAP